MGYNITLLSKEEMEKIKVDLAASGVVFKERYSIPVIPKIVEREQPKHLRSYFCARITNYRIKYHKIFLHK